MSARIAAAVLSLGLAACAARPTRAPQPDADARFVAAAVSMLGQPYRYGGDAPGGFDCSGLAYFAARSAGFSLPRTAAEQSLAGAAVARRRIRAGDLIFMHFPHEKLHVGIAIGAAQFVHAPSRHGRVRIDSLRSPPYARAYLGARRLRLPP